MLVRDVMSCPVVTVEPHTPVRAAATLLAVRGFTALPVIDGEGELVGIVTEADLLRDRVRHDARSPLFGVELAAGPPPSSVADVMTVDVVTVQPSSDVADLVERMRVRGIRSAPVVGAAEELVGIVSRRDVLQTVTRTDAEIAVDVRRRLENYAGPGRWDVTVQSGTVTLGDPFGDEAEQHTAAVIAAAARGVVDVRVANRVE